MDQHPPHGDHDHHETQPPGPLSWLDLLFHHERRCRDIIVEIESNTSHDADRGHGHAVVHALLALVQVQKGHLRELRKIRRVAEAIGSNQVAAFHLTGTLIPKEGLPMPAGPFNPTNSQDVFFKINPVNAAGAACVGPFDWSVSDQAGGVLQVAADYLSARLVTALGAIDIVAMVKQASTGYTETAAVSRSGLPTDDNNVVGFSLSGELVDKTAV